MADQQHPHPPTTPTPTSMPLPSASSGGSGEPPGSAVGSPQDPATPLAAFQQQPLADHQTVESLSDLEVDSGHSSDGDSALGSEVSSYVLSLPSSSLSFFPPSSTQGGRRGGGYVWARGAVGLSRLLYYILGIPKFPKKEQKKG